MPIASIDVHSHALPQAYLDALAELGVDPVAEDGFPTPTWSEEAHLRFMEETGQEFCILSLSTPHIHRGDDAAAARHARAINDELANVYETGIMVDLNTVYPEKKERYITPYVQWLNNK